MANDVKFVAALADGRTCLSLDREGEARLTLIVSQQEAAKLVGAWPSLMNRSLKVTLKPEEP